MTSKEIIYIEDKYGAHNYHPLDVVIEKAKGVWVWDVDGNKYLDCLAAYSAVNQGHCHPRIVNKAKEQLEKVTLTSRAFRNDQLPFLCKELCELTGYEMMLPMNSGAEAVETALKAARKWGYKIKGVEENKAEIICCTNNFSGRTISIISFSTEEQYKDGFGPFTPGYKIVPYGDAELLEQMICSNTVAFLVEPIQGEGGVIVPPDGYLQKAFEICRKNNVLFIADEIQSGLGRSGKLFAFEYEKIRPDVVIVGKALSGGCYPVSAVLADKKLLGVFNPGDHGSTFGGNPLGAAIARESIKVLIEEKLIENSFEMGNYFREKLNEVESKHVKEIRGKGLFIGVELHPEAGGARRFCEALKNRGLLCKETHTNVIRFAPPLVITKKEIDWAMEQVAEVLVME
ncbi:MAG: ornithine--oxo-acid transaminase [Ignavibacteria bacterium CG_4_8_14_3_um_filter_37_9]|nr:ornithine--oxo-acid transaminase [Ignavibacteria bacterium]OIO17704.1 MAG: ornithine--oxo-acid transaminase [Ignavibacteria bacterium CG1_02_37_35]PIP79645.1 MAG: ornithine--oxo-acid transaminase [Ignavibacteria bacterium CG22_combo_CG10-13_8_21_14_all_37_15]PIS44501.1 MAG: ornithine--oxo-acid transaminase [Ignavibacteria bacterium CG08_land_8_20_14_0_20_37_9]PIW97967.1 MAG: ornithine--oxo-acid transaminase [Ignavibacteria bacterium CG_4_8_14_3_um_filter_37_9]PIX94388.1 MAG: ornithine--oxo-